MVIVSPGLCRLLSWVVPISGITLWPFILLAQPPDEVTVNHERIHIRQQAELLLLGFYTIYIYEWLHYRALGMKGDQAYLLLRFEREAYAHEKELDYLKTRPFWAWKQLQA